MWSEDKDVCDQIIRDFDPVVFLNVIVNPALENAVDELWNRKVINSRPEEIAEEMVGVIERGIYQKVQECLDFLRTKKESEEYVKSLGRDWKD